MAQSNKAKTSRPARWFLLFTFYFLLFTLSLPLCAQRPGSQTVDSQQQQPASPVPQPRQPSRRDLMIESEPQGPSARVVPAKKTLVIADVNLIDATGGPMQREVTVVVKQGRITQIAKRALINLGRDVEVVNASGKYLIPGLWDMHVHLVQRHTGEEVTGTILPLLVANGVTGVRDMGGDLAMLKELRAEIAAGRIRGPRMVISGPMIDGNPPVYQPAIAVTEAGEARVAVDKLEHDGVDFIKVQSALGRDAFFAVAQESANFSLPFVGHVPESVTPVEASEAGMASQEHMLGILLACSSDEAALRQRDAAEAANPPKNAEEANAFGQERRNRIVASYSSEKAAALGRTLVKNDTWITPTLVFLDHVARSDDAELDHTKLLQYIPQRIRQQWQSDRQQFLAGRSADNLASWKAFLRKHTDAVHDLHAAKVSFLAGTDLGAADVVPGFSLHEELELLTRAGLTPEEALQSATSAAARFMHARKTGTIQVGNLADMVLLDANPLAEIQNTRRIYGVVLRGQYLPRTELDKMLAAAAQAAKE